jgi:hypothetical protein
MEMLDWFIENILVPVSLFWIVIGGILMFIVAPVYLLLKFLYC